MTNKTRHCKQIKHCVLYRWAFWVCFMPKLLGWNCGMGRILVGIIFICGFCIFLQHFCSTCCSCLLPPQVITMLEVDLLCSYSLFANASVCISLAGSIRRSLRIIQSIERLSFHLFCDILKNDTIDYLYHSTRIHLFY